MPGSGGLLPPQTRSALSRTCCFSGCTKFLVSAKFLGSFSRAKVSRNSVNLLGESSWEPKLGRSQSFKKSLPCLKDRNVPSHVSDIEHKHALFCMGDFSVFKLL